MESAPAWKWKILWRNEERKVILLKISDKKFNSKNKAVRNAQFWLDKNVNPDNISPTIHLTLHFIKC